MCAQDDLTVPRSPSAVDLEAEIIQDGASSQSACPGNFGQICGSSEALLQLYCIPCEYLELYTPHQA